jgi:hypothetical protein
MIPQWFKAFDLARQHQRQRQRVARYFDCTWQSPWGPQRSRISSISPTGCYIEERFSVPRRGEAVREVSLELPTGPIRLEGTVLDTMRGVGFAVRFVHRDADARDRLNAFVYTVRTQDAAPA